MSTQSVNARKEYVDNVLAQHQALLDKYKGTQYENMLSNPYADMESRPGFFGIGFNRREYQRMQRLLEVDAENQANIAALEYKDPSAEYRRQSQAGINPDLSGLSESGTPAIPSFAGSPDMNPEGEGFQKFSNLAQGLLSVASIAMSIPQGMAELSARNLANALSMEDLASGHLADFLPVSEDGTFTGNILNYAKIFGTNLPYLSSALFPHSKSDRKQFEATFRQMMNSSGAKLQRFQTAGDLARAMADPYLQSEYPPIVQAVTMASIKNELKKLEINAKYDKIEADFLARNESKLGDLKDKSLEAQENSYTADIAEAGAAVANAGAVAAEAAYRSKYAKEHDPSAEAQYQNQEAITAAREAELKKADMDTIEEVNDFMEEFWHGDVFSKDHWKKIHYGSPNYYMRQRRRRKEAERSSGVDRGSRGSDVGIDFSNVWNFRRNSKKK